MDPSLPSTHPPPHHSVQHQQEYNWREDAALMYSSGNFGLFSVLCFMQNLAPKSLIRVHVPYKTQDL
jgi:hypothetical protein